MLHYASFDEAWGTPIAPRIKNPYRVEAHAEDEDLIDETIAPAPKPRCDEQICRDHLTTVYATQGPAGLRRVLGPHMCGALQPKRPSVFDVIEIEELMLFVFFGVVVYLLS